MAPMLSSRSFSIDEMVAGMERFLLGLGKKVLLADAFGRSVSNMLSSPMDGPTAWLVVLFFSLQLYLDFSGYSDMAIGIGRVFGFSFQDNFNFPYISTSVGEFWRRWHISLGAWFREYVYVPLGGSRRGNVYLNLFIVFFLTGIWHGSTNIYLCWGVAHGLCVMAERTALYRRLRSSLPFSSFFGWLYTMLVVGLGWMCFQLAYVSDFLNFLKNLAGVYSGELVFTWQFYLTPKMIVISLCSIAGIWIFSRPQMQRRLWNWNETSLLFCTMKYLVLLIVAVLCFCSIVANGYAPFLYFQY